MCSKSIAMSVLHLPYSRIDLAGTCFFNASYRGIDCWGTVCLIMGMSGRTCLFKFGLLWN